MFNYIQNCTVPEHGFDIIYKPSNKKTIYVEMKNKHNTMNSDSSQKIYIQMQNQILKDNNCECYLVECIAKHSQNIVWKISINGEKVNDERIRRVSIDKFYEIVTGEKDAFYKICMALPEIIDEVINENTSYSVEKDTVLSELQQTNPNILKALYILAFKEYEGFEDFKY